MHRYFNESEQEIPEILQRLISPSDQPKNGHYRRQTRHVAHTRHDHVHSPRRLESMDPVLDLFTSSHSHSSQSADSVLRFDVHTANSVGATGHTYKTSSTQPPPLADHTLRPKRDVGYDSYETFNEKWCL